MLHISYLILLIAVLLGHTVHVGIIHVILLSYHDHVVMMMSHSLAIRCHVPCVVSYEMMLQRVMHHVQ